MGDSIYGPTRALGWRCRQFSWHVLGTGAVCTDALVPMSPARYLQSLGA
jgi:hypothetical protein